VTKSLVLIGAGHAHVEVMRTLSRAAPDAAVTLITPHTEVPYTGMVPGLVAGKYRFDEVAIDAAALAARAGVAMRKAKATAIDRAARVVQCDDGGAVPYDILSINIGARSRLPIRADAGARVLATKPVEPFIEALTRLLAGAAPTPLAVIGAGYGGVELSAALAHRGAEVSLIAGKAGLAPTAPAGVRRALSERLRQRGVAIIAGADAQRVDESGVRLDDGRVVAAAAVVLAAGVAPPPLVEALDAPKDAHGFLALAPTLQSKGDAAIFAAGDCASPQDGLPKAGVFAVRQGPILARNLCAALIGAPLAAFHPQKDYLAILSFWPDGAVAVRGGFGLGGRRADRWKEAIDRRFMARYR